MTTAFSTVTPEVAAFVAEVRARLADLTDEEREELVGGLEADLTDQLADGATWSELGEPASYAAELRLAAGLPERSRRTRLPSLPTSSSVEGLLDRSRDRFLALVTDRPWRRTAWDVVVELRPVWWVARAWVAVTALDVAAGHWEPISVVPSLGHPLLGPALLVVAVVVSVLVGQGRLWPRVGPDRPILHRVALLVLNAVALVAPLWFYVPMPGYLSGGGAYGGVDAYSAGYHDARAETVRSGLHAGRKQITNVFAYGPDGTPLGPVQLFDQDGEPIAVPRTTGTGRRDDRRVVCPAYNGTTPLYNVFPLDVAPLRRGWCQPDTEDITTPVPPLAEVPPLAGATEPVPDPAPASEPSAPSSPSVSPR